MRRKKARPAKIALVALGAIIATICLGGCRATAEVTSPWPNADAERAIPRPPSPPRWPLTGLDAPSDAALLRRVVAVKVENSPAARPQSGLNKADVVYESLSEGGITRFNAIFHSQTPASVGPVRSARLADIHIVPQFQALFVFSGASGSVNARIRAAGLPNLSEDAGVTKCYTRISSRRRPHNLYVDISKARDVGVERGHDAEKSIKAFAFDRSVVPTSTEVLGVTIPFSPASKASWKYDAASRTYLRSDNGRPTSDAVTGKRLAARNVVVMWARTTEADKRDVAGSPTLDITLTGTGRVTVFRDGLRFDGMWIAQKGAPPQFKAEDGTLIKLRPGNTWVQVIPTTANIAME